MPTQLLADRERAALKVVELAKDLALVDNHFLSTAVGGEVRWRSEAF